MNQSYTVFCWLSLAVASKRQQSQHSKVSSEASRRLTLLSDNLTDSMKEASVARSEGALVMDQLNLKDERETILSDTK